MAVKVCHYKKLYNYHAVAEENLFVLIYVSGYLLEYAKNAFKLRSNCEHGCANKDKGVEVESCNESEMGA